MSRIVEGPFLGCLADAWLGMGNGLQTSVGFGAEGPSGLPGFRVGFQGRV